MSADGGTAGGKALRGVILYMDAMGPRASLAGMAQRLADSGHVVLLPDLFYRFGAYGPFTGASFGDETARGQIMTMLRETSQEMTRRDTAAFIDALEGGAELVMGNRFQGGIEPGAMPLLHRYLGNPVLSFVGRLFFRTRIGDFHCGLRGFSRDAIARAVDEAELVIGAVLVPGAAAPKLVTRDMLKTMKRGSVLVDIAIDQGGCFETSHPTTHRRPGL